MIIKQHIKWLLPIALLAVSACDPKVDNRGYVSNAQWKDNVIVGTTTKDAILGTFGSPSVQSSFGDETWYYVTERKETVAFLRPEVTEQNVVRITFDANGVVSNMESFDKNNSKEFDIAKRITPTEGHQLGFLEQVLGNIGRFNKPGSSDSVAPGRRTKGGF